MTRSVNLRTEGHLIDTGLLSRYLALVVENGAAYELRHFEIGRFPGTTPSGT